MYKMEIKRLLFTLENITSSHECFLLSFVISKQPQDIKHEP